MPGANRPSDGSLSQGSVGSDLEIVLSEAAARATCFSYSLLEFLGLLLARAVR